MVLKLWEKLRITNVTSGSCERGIFKNVRNINIRESINPKPLYKSLKC